MGAITRTFANQIKTGGKLDADGLDLTDTFAFSGTVTGAGGDNTPAFEAYLGTSGGQSPSDNTVTKVQINTEVFDTDSCYDHITNYRFTPTTAGKYFVYGRVQGDASATDFNGHYIYLRKNGSNVLELTRDFYNNQVRADNIQFSIVVDMNGTTDYLELFGRIDTIGGTSQVFEGDPQWKRGTSFGAYKIIE